MARSLTPKAKLKMAQLTPDEMQQGINRLQKRLEEVDAFDPTSVIEQFNIPHVEALATSIDDALIRTFGADTLRMSRPRIMTRALVRIVPRLLPAVCHQR
jgi:hypothetical protein